MFDNQNKKISLIIVYDVKTREYANYLMALIGQNDDKDGKVIGTKDGSISAVMYTPKQYKDTLPKITSNTNILFMGNFKEANEQRKNVNIMFNKYGMKYGWLGKRAVMYVEDSLLKKDEYKDFLEFSKNYQQEFEDLTANAVNSLKWTFANYPYKYNPLLAHPKGLITSSSVATNMLHMEIREQQYRCLTMALYLDGLQKFLEG